MAISDSMLGFVAAKHLYVVTHMLMSSPIEFHGTIHVHEVTCVFAG